MPEYFPFRSADPSVTAEDCILPETAISFSYQATNLSEYVTDVSISASRGQALTGSVTLKDRTGFLAAFVSQFNQTDNDYRSHNMTDTRTVSLTLGQGSNAVDYPTLIPGDPQWDNDATLTWSFSDKTPIIDLDNQTIGDYLFTEGDDETSHTIIDDIETAIGETITPGFSAYDIGTFRANETNVLSALDELQSARQAYRKWEDGVLTLEKLAEASPVMHIIDRFHIPREGGLTGTKDTSGLRTYFKFFRDVPQASALGEAQCTGLLGTESQCVGRVVEITFDRPTMHAHIIHTETNGSIEDGVFYDASNAPLPNVGGWFDFFGSIGFEAVKWIGTYVPDFVLGTDMYIPSWRVKAVGGPISSGEFGNFESETTLTTLEALYGHRPEYKNLETELLRDEASADAMLNAIALEAMWSVDKWNLSTPFLIPGREGDFCSVTHAKHGLNMELCLIHSFSHSYGLGRGWSNSYELRTES